MRVQPMLVACLLFSGLCALVYQVLWTRLLGFVFGTTTEAIGTVLAVFFGGLAIGNLAAARLLDRIERPFRAYALLELSSGAFALLSLPLLRKLDLIYGMLGVDHSAPVMAAIRVVASASVMLPPTIAMGATLPVVARGLVLDDRRLGHGTAVLYAANTSGAVLGAYLSGFWLVPGLGLGRTLFAAAIVNLGVGFLVLHRVGNLRHDQLWRACEARPDSGPDADRLSRIWLLACFGLSGFVAIGYEIVWSKVLTIVMEGTVYSFSSVLSAYLFGLAAGSLAIARRVDRIGDLARFFGLLHIGVVLCVACGTMLLGDLPHFHRQLSGGGVHTLFVLSAPIVLVPALLFGASFPVLVRLYTARAARTGEGIGLGTAVNTLGSIAASLLVAFWSIPMLGSDTTLRMLLLLELAMAGLVLVAYPSRRGAARWVAAAGSVCAFIAVGIGYRGVHLDRIVSGRDIEAATLEEYRAQQRQSAARTELVIEGRGSVVTVHRTDAGLDLRTNGLPESGIADDPPYRSLDTFLLGVVPYLAVEHPGRALVIGLGGGATVDALRLTSLEKIDVVELESSVVDAASLLYRGRGSPWKDPRVALHVNDGRNYLLMRRFEDGPAYDMIASQPSHPWLAGSANLFTEEFFRLVRENLAPDGVFSLWVNGFRTDRDSLLAIIASFDRVFPGGVLVSGARGNPYMSLILVGGVRPLRWSLEQMRARFAEPRLHTSFLIHELQSVEAVLSRVEGRLESFARLAPDAANTDDNVFVETHLAGLSGWEPLDFAALARDLPPAAPVLPAMDRPADVLEVADAVLESVRSGATRSTYARKVLRLLRAHANGRETFRAQVLDAEARLWSESSPRQAGADLERLAMRHPERPEALRALGSYAAIARRDFALAARCFEEAWRRSRAARDAYDVARASYRLDRTAVAAWVDRIPVAERAAYPRLALFDAERALLAGDPPATLRERRRALRRYRDTAEGRALLGLDETLARLADRLGDHEAARAFADADFRTRRRVARPLLEDAAEALGSGKLDAAQRWIDAARSLVPGAPGLLELAVRIAGAREDASALARAFAELRAWAPTLDTAIGTENRLRAELGLELLPERDEERLIAGEPMALSRR